MGPALGRLRGLNFEVGIERVDLRRRREGVRIGRAFLVLGLAAVVGGTVFAWKWKFWMVSLEFLFKLNFKIKYILLETPR